MKSETVRSTCLSVCCGSALRAALTALAAFFVLAAPAAGPLRAEVSPKARTPEEILGPSGRAPSSEAVLELFINASEWDGAHQAVRAPSEEALAGLGGTALPPILKMYLVSTDVRRRVSLDTLVKKIGPPAAEHLLAYLKSSDSEVRRHAAYLLGETAFAATKDDPALAGPFAEDQASRAALLAVLEAEKEEKVVRSMVGALGRFRDPGLVPPVAAYLDNPAESVRLNAAITLGYVPHASAVDALAKALSDKAGSVRQAAILALASKSVCGSQFGKVEELARKAPRGGREHVAALEAITRFLSSVESDTSAAVASHRATATALAKEILDKRDAGGAADWRARGYAVSLLRFAEDRAGALSYLDDLRGRESHPFVIGRIDETARTLRTGGFRGP